jgi:hypothetical protein
MAASQQRFSLEAGATSEMVVPTLALYARVRVKRRGKATPLLFFRVGRIVFHEPRVREPDSGRRWRYQALRQQSGRK